MSQVYGRATQTYKGKEHILLFFRETWDNIISEEPFINEKGKIRYTPEQKDNEDYKNTLQVVHWTTKSRYLGHAKKMQQNLIKKFLTNP